MNLFQSITSALDNTLAADPTAGETQFGVHPAVSDTWTFGLFVHKNEIVKMFCLHLKDYTVLTIKSGQTQTKTVKNKYEHFNP